MERRTFIGLGIGGLVAAYFGQCYIFKNPVGKFLNKKFGEKPFYEGSDISVAVGKFFEIPGKDLTAITESGFDPSKVLRKPIRVYGEEMYNVVSGQRTKFVRIDKIKSKVDDSEIYERDEDKPLMMGDLPSREVRGKDKYRAPKNFTYKNKDSWEKLGTNKIKLTGTISDDYQYIFVKDEKDGETNKIKVESISDWVKYLLQGQLKGKELEIYAIVKDTVDWKQRKDTRELFNAVVYYVLPKGKEKINSVGKVAIPAGIAAVVWQEYQKRYLKPA